MNPDEAAKLTLSSMAIALSICTVAICMYVVLRRKQ